MNAMEARKGHVQSFNQSAEDLIQMIGPELPIMNGVRTQVADIHECWNSVVKQIIEVGTKVITS